MVVLEKKTNKLVNTCQTIRQINGMFLIILPVIMFLTFFDYSIMQFFMDGEIS